MEQCDVAIIGGGPAGLAAAVEARNHGAAKVLLLERNQDLGGILPQCIHNGFGSVLFKQDYPGPLYANKFIEQVRAGGIEVRLDTTVLELTPSRRLYATSSSDGYQEIQAGAVVLAMGCRERTRPQIRLAGDRPAGVYTAGTVQRLVNIEGYMPGREFVILGSGDIGMIMARRLTVEGAKVKCVLEALPYLTGLRRNYVQCLQDFGIPLALGTTVKRIIGGKRVEAVETVQVDGTLNPIAGTEQLIPCDTLLLSVGLIPENELSRKAGVHLDERTQGPVVNERMETSLPGIFAAGNVVTIYDLVDYVSKAGMIAGREAARFVKSRTAAQNSVPVTLNPGAGVRTLIPQILHADASRDTDLILEFRVDRVFDGKVHFELTDGLRVFETFTEPYARPAEMVTRRIKAGPLLESLPPQVRSLELRVLEATVESAHV
jgi:NADPH-dependent 2,4-dienoyl-CoA reductase/sulfur reductase-like enzyme